MVINPMAAFSAWFNALSQDHKQRLAHIFYVCTTQNTTDMLAQPQTSLARFAGFFTRQDFPLRTVAKMFTVRTIFDLLLVHRKELVSRPETWIPGHSRDKMIPLGPRQWDQVYASWARLRTRELSDPYLHAWAASILKKKEDQENQEHEV